MIAKTKYFGEIEYTTDDIIYFPNGLFGFEASKRFLAIPFDISNDHVISLQDLDNENLSFIIMNPFQLFETYAPKPSVEDLKFFENVDEENLSYYVIAVLNDTLGASTLNLKAPIIVDVQSHTGKQVILPQEEYSFRHQFPQNHSKEDSVC